MMTYLEMTNMTMADPHRNNPESPYCRPLADPIPADHAGGHHWTPTDFKPDVNGKWHAVPRNNTQPDPEHLDRLGLMETQIGGTHYLGKPMQPWDVIEAWGLDFWEGNCLKYLLRRKPGTDRITDLRKAQHYLARCIEREEAKGG